MFTQDTPVCPFDARNGAEIIATLRKEGKFAGKLLDRIYIPIEERDEATQVVVEGVLPLMVDAVSKDASGVVGKAIFTVAIALALSRIQDEHGIEANFEFIESTVHILTSMAQGVALDRLSAK